MSDIFYMLPSTPARYELQQCKITKDGTHQTVWIPEEFAVVGKKLCIRHEYGWEVAEVYSERITDIDMATMEQEHRFIVKNWKSYV